MERYSYWIGAAKGCKEGVYAAIAMALTVAMMRNLVAGDLWAFIITSASGAAALKFIRNWMSMRGFTLKDLLGPTRFLAICAVLYALAGCSSTAKTGYSIDTWSEGPDGKMYRNREEAHAKSKAGLFGQVPEGVHTIDSKNADGEGVVMGQTARIDNTGQVEAMRSMVQGLAALGQVMGPYIAPQQPAPAPDSAAIGSIIERLVSTLDAINQALADIKAANR